MTAPYGRAQAGGYLWRGGAGAASARVRIGRMAGSGPASGAARREHRDGSTAAAVRLHIPAGESDTVAWIHTLESAMAPLLYAAA